jgi:integrase
MAETKLLNSKLIQNTEATNKRQKLLDGDGLYLFISPKPYGNKAFYYRYKNYNGEDKSYKIGDYPKVSLKQARVTHSLLQQDVASGICPMEERKGERVNKKIKVKKNTFADVAEKWFEYRTGRVEASTVDKEIARVRRFIYPKYENIPCEEMNSRDLVNLLTKVAHTNELAKDGRKNGGIETAHRTMRHVASIFKYGLNLGLIDKTFPNIAYGQTEYLPADKRSKKEKSRAAILQAEQLGRYMYKVENDERKYDLTGCFMRLIAHVPVRHSELLSMKWKDIDFKKKEWNFDIQKTKRSGVEEFVVFLTEPVIEILKDIQKITGDELSVFYSDTTNDGHISNATTLKRLRDLGFSKDESTIHGFRATIMTLGRQELKADKWLIELALAHVVKDPNGYAYDRADFPKERRQFMNDWSDYLIECKRQFQRSLIRSV